MKIKTCKILIFLLYNAIFSFAQVNKNLELMFSEDTIWKTDIPVKVEQFIELRKYVLTNQQNNRYQFFDELDSTLIAKILALDTLYQLEVEEFVNWFTETSIDKKPVGYSYLSTKLEFEKLFHLPKCYAILLNPIRKNIIKKLKPERFIYAGELVEEIFSIIKKNGRLSEIEEETKKYMKEIESFESQLFKGSISEELKLKYSLINFLLLASRAK